MTPAHVESVAMGVASLQDEADNENANANMYASRSISYFKHKSRERVARDDAARLAEVAAYLKGQMHDD